jgi:hypothetical protein
MFQNFPRLREQGDWVKSYKIKIHYALANNKFGEVYFQSDILSGLYASEKQQLLEQWLDNESKSYPWPIYKVIGVQFSIFGQIQYLCIGAR